MLERYLTQQVSVETYTGEGATGPVYAEATLVACYLEHGRRLVLAANGTEVVSDTKLIAALDTVDTFRPESRVTINGTTCRVLSVESRDPGPLSLDGYVEVAL